MAKHTVSYSRLAGLLLLFGMAIRVNADISELNELTASVGDYAEYTAIAETIRGQLRPVRYTTLSAGMTGTLLEVKGSPGRYVKEGDILARFDCRAEQAERDVAAAKKEGAEARYRVNSRLAELDNISGLELSLSKAELAIANSELKLIDVRLSHCEVRAPFSGQMVSKQVQSWQFAGMGDPLFELVDTSRMEVEMVLQSRWLHRLPPGTPFNLAVDETGATIAATVDRVVSNIDPVSQTIRIIGVPAAMPDNLLPGMSGQIHIGTASASVAP